MPTSYSIVFRPKAEKRFSKLDLAIRQQVARKLLERANNPRVQGDALSGMKDCYRLKFRASGVRIVYQVRDFELVLLVLAVGRREGEEAYEDAAAALAKLDD